MTIAIAILIGLASGVCGGLFGLGGGIIIVPALVYFLGMQQKQAQGTSLFALLLPAGALAAWTYWKSAPDAAHQREMIQLGLWVAAGFFFGGLAGSKIAVPMSDVLLRRIFAVFLVLVAAQLFFKKS